ncbi:Na+/H+ antiporter subunit D [Agrococcus casei]|uniref:Na+/H+ antiporter subunit D n=1 Tax=Agrococcus casei TaxID=343512 RepID=UPI003F8FF0F7
MNVDIPQLLPLPVLIPLIGAGFALALGRFPRMQRVVSSVSLSLVLIVAIILLVTADTEGPQVLWVGAWPEGLGIMLVADRLSALMLLVSSVVTITVLVFSARSDMDEASEKAPVSIFHPTYLVLAAGISNAFLAGDLFNLFVGFEMLLFASYVLLTLGAPRERVRAGSTYVVVSLLSSMLFLITLAITYAATGTVNFAQLAERLQGLDPGMQLVIQLMLLVVFGIKAAIFPLSAWLPDSYPTAPASVTAVFAGLLTKVGVYAIIRTQTMLFPDSTLTTPLLWVSLATMVIGILGAITQSEIKRLLSFTLISHIGYMLFGIAVGNVAGLSGAIFYAAHHIFIQTALFLVSALIERAGGSTRLDKLGGLAANTTLAALFFIPAMNLAGVPPFSGFLGKVALVEAGVELGSWVSWAVIAGAIVTSLLTLLAILRIWHTAFWRPLPEGTDRANKTLPLGWVLAAGVLVAVTVAMTVFAGPIFEFTERAAVDIDAGAYAAAVEESIRKLGTP